MQCQLKAQGWGKMHRVATYKVRAIDFLPNCAGGKQIGQQGMFKKDHRTHGQTRQTATSATDTQDRPVQGNGQELARGIGKKDEP